MLLAIRRSRYKLLTFNCFNVFIFDFHLHLIKSLAIYTDYGTLTYKGIWVDDLDDTEDGDALVLLCQDTEHLHLVARVPAMTVKNGYTMVHLRTDGVGYLLIFLAEYHELHTFSFGIHYIVEYQVLYHHRTETEYHLSNGVYRSKVRLRIEDEERTAYDEEIYEDEHPAQ